MDARLEVEIGADIKDLQGKLANAIKGLDNLKKEQKDLANAFKKGDITQDKYYSDLAKNTARLSSQSKLVNNYKNSLNGLGDTFNKSKKGIISGDSALTSFSRTIQDAPFGIMGVSNNITNLTEQFGYLKAKTGSSGSALKAMLSSLKGFGGISLLISVATSALLVFGDEISNLIKGNKSLASSQREVNKALNDFYGNSVSKLHSYVSILEDANTSEEQRKEITEELIKKVPTLTKEDFKYGTNLDVVRGKIGQYVLAQASRIEADTLVQENSEKLAKQAKIVQMKNIKDETKRIKAFTKFLKDEGERVTKTSITSTYISKGHSTEIAKTKDEITNDFNNFASDLEKELKPVQDKINQLYSTTFNGGLGSDGGNGGDKEKKTVNSKVQSVFEGLKNSYISGVEGFKEITTSNPTNLLGSTITQFEIDQANLKARIQEFNMQVSEMLSASRFDALSNLGTAIGNAMGSGQSVLKAAGASLLSTLGGIMVKYGKMAIAYGLASEALKAAFKNPFGGGIGAVIAGTALVAIGSAIKSFSSNIASGGGGGTTTSNATAGGGTNNNSNFSSGFSGGYGNQNGGNVVFQIAGDKLIGVLKNTLDNNRSLGGNIVIG
jgi:hypothetical protein